MTAAAPRVRYLELVRLPRPDFRLGAISSIYVAVLWSCYRYAVPDTYSGFGNGLNEMSGSTWTYALVLSVLPALVLPRDPGRPSTFLVHIQYWLIYVPACLLLWHTTRPELEQADVVRILAILAVSMLILIAGSRSPRLRVSVFRPSAARFDTMLRVTLLVLAAVVGLTLGSNFQFVGVLDVGDLRAQAVESSELAGSRIGFYALMWASAALSPFVFARAVMTKSRAWVLVPLATLVFLYGIAGHRAMLAGLILLPTMAWLMAKAPLRFPAILPAALVVLLLGGLPLLVWAGDTSGILFSAAIYSRTFSVPTLAIAQYVDFFRSNPFTHLSHVKPFSLVLHYPFDDDLPFVVGRYFYDFPIGLNAGLWAGDGIASFGLPGVILASMFAAVVFWVLDSAAWGVSILVCTLSVSYVAISFTNISLMTTLWSGGLILVIAMLLLSPRDELQALSHGRNPPGLR